MVKLPNVQSLGESPVPQSRAPILSPSNPGVAERAAQQTSPALDQAIAQTMSVIDKQASLQEGADRLARLRDFREKANTETNRVLTQEDIASPEVTRAYGMYMNQLEQETLKSHGGRPESMAKLGELLFSTKAGLVENVSKKGAEALYKKSVTALGEEANFGAQRISANPYSWRNEWADFSKIADMAQLSPEARREQKSTALAYYAEQAAISMILKRDTDTATDILGDEEIARAMPEARRTRLLKAIDAANKPMDPKDRYMVAGDRVIDLAAPGGAPKVVINAPPKDDRTDIQKDADDLGLKGAEREQFIRDYRNKPGVSIDMKGEGSFTSTLGDIDAKKLAQLRDNAELAHSKLVNIRVIQESIEGGTFKVGTLGEYRSVLARAAEFIGVPDNIKKVIGAAETADAIDSAAKMLAINEVPKLGRTIVAGLDLIKEAGPALWKSEEGNLVWMEIMKRVAEREILMAELAEEIADKEKSLSKRRNSYLSALRSFEDKKSKNYSPIITPEIAERLRTLSKAPDRTLINDIKGANGNQPPEGVKIPAGHTFVGIDRKSVV